MSNKLPTIAGNELIRLLKKEGWIEKRKKKHVFLYKKFTDGQNRTTIIKATNKPLPRGTLMDILSKDQTGLGRQWLINQFN